MITLKTLPDATAQEVYDQASIEVEPMFKRLPFCVDWVSYKGEIFFAMVNYDASIKAKKPMIDLCYCATRGLNGQVLKTVQYDKKKFEPCRLTHSWG